ncbi:MAG: thiamine pyrophosphate-binding protein [Candidatus Rokubacteria bacterium]|nr:thiamine pyrophosphate-binding protein [Candidatus Rokubacteria bacterium]
MTSVADVTMALLARAGAPLLVVAGEAAGAVGAAERRGLPMLRVATEAGAVFAAAAAADIESAPGAVVIAGGDAGRIAAALDVARREQIPLVCLTSVDDARLTDVAKATLHVVSASASHWIAQALRLSLARPRGPVHLVVPDELWTAPTVPVATAVQRAPSAAPDTREVARAATLIRSAVRPVVIAGGDGRDAAAWIRAFTEALAAPIVTTWKGRGVVADPHPLCFGLATSGGGRRVLARADLVIALGLTAVDLVDFAARAPVLLVGVGLEPDALLKPALSIATDVGTLLAELAPRLGGARADWDVAELDRWKRATDTRSGVTADLDPARVVAIAREAMPAGTIAAFDSALRDAAAGWDCVAPGDLVVTARAEARGFAVPAAIAAASLRRDAVALAFTDVAGFGAAAGELATAARVGAAIGVIVVGDDDTARAAIAVPPGVSHVRAATSTSLAIELGRVLGERRPLVVDATASAATRPV